jgi:hypothetical protein
MSEGGFSTEGGVPTYQPKIEDKIRTMEPEVKPNPDWKEDKKPDWAEPSVADVDRLLKPTQVTKDVLRNLNPEPKK